MLEELREDESPSGPLLQACLNTLAVLFTTLPAKNPLKRAVARFEPLISGIVNQF